MKLKYLAAVSLLALASAGAHAATLSYDLGSSTNAGTLTEISGSNDYDASMLHNGTSFIDYWTLAITENPAANTSISFTDFTVAGLFDITFTSGSGLTFTSTNDNSYVFEGPLSTGTYNIILSGNTSGLLGGLYSIELNATPTAAPVPIPPAALLFGSALIGLAGLRRKKAAKELVEA